MTTNLQQTLLESDPNAMSELFDFLVQHHSGDWGEMPVEDQEQNEIALKEGNRLMSAYTTRGGIRLWIITEWDRSVTTARLTEDY